MTYHDDNFGAWGGMEDLDMQEFYQKVQQRSVEKVCVDYHGDVPRDPVFSGMLEALKEVMGAFIDNPNMLTAMLGEEREARVRAVIANAEESKE